MIIAETRNIDEIKSVLCDPWVYDRITGDNAPDASDWTPPLEGEHYLKCVASHAIVGVSNCHPINEVCWECHIQVLPDYRRYAHSFMDASIKWTWDNTPAKKLVVQIPSFYKDVIKFVQEHGFTIEGVNQKSHLKHGALWDQVYMGLQHG